MLQKTRTYLSNMGKKKFKMMPAEPPLQIDINTIRQFRYNKGAVNLNFDLNITKRQELADFVELLKQAVIDVGETLNPPSMTVKK